MKLAGYADKLSVEPGGHVSFMISSEPTSFRADLVRLIHGDINPSGPGFKFRPVVSSFEGVYEGHVQVFHPGSFVSVPDRGPLAMPGDFTIQMWIQPTTPEKDVQTLISRRDGAGNGYALRLEGGRLTLEIGDQRLSTRAVATCGEWYFVVASYEAASRQARLLMDQWSGVVIDARDETSGRLTPSQAVGAGELLVAAEALTQQGEIRPGNFFNGKIDSPRIYGRVLTEADLAALRDGGIDEVGGLPVAAWDFSIGISNWTVTDTSGNDHHGAAIHKPLRGTTGRNWDGTELAWTRAPEQYGAIHFHDDDLADAAWDKSFEWKVPNDLPSGVYAARVSAGGDEDFIPITVAPHLGQAQAPIALVLPVFSYLAYGNEQMAADGTLSGQVESYPRLPEDAYIIDNGLRSLYDRHTDGSGVYYSSWLRPIVNMRPKYTQAWLDNGRGSPHQFPADLHLVDWLVEMGYEFDVLTDLELHRDGLARLEDYQVVLTGTHAEYTSVEMLDAYEAYLNGGGRLMYLSGNGMFWVTQLDPDTQTSIEIRRRSGNVWTWPSAPGEAHLSSTGEPGGLWSLRGRTPHKWLGVGMNSEGAGPGRPYRRQPDSFDPRAAFVFEGIGDDELIGDFPSLVNSWGAAGFEIDWADSSWGTPHHTLILATADGFTEEYELSHPAGVLIGGATQFPPLQCDMALVEYPNNGAVFSTGSISWCACLSHNSYDNNVSRVMRNVLEAFMQEVLPGQTADNQEADA